MSTELAGDLKSEDEDGIDYGQQGIRLLIRQLQSRPGIVPYVGAGVSDAYGLPLWSQFLSTVSHDLEVAAKVQALVGQGDFEEAAESLIESMGRLVFNDAVEDAFGDHAIEEPTEVSTAYLLTRIASGPVITTNFDHVLELTFEKAGVPFERVVWGARADSIVSAMQTNDRFLLKIHGDVDDTGDRVLTRSEYFAKYGNASDENEATGSLTRLVERMLGSRTLLFIGCSLRNDRVVQILSATAQQLGSFTHFAIVSYPDSQRAFEERRRFLSELNIRPIWIPNGRYDLVPELLRYIAEKANAAISSVTLSPFTDPDTFFKPLLRGGGKRLLHHAWSLVGRAEYLQFLDSWVTNNQPIAFLVGRGGIGKSRLLRTFAEDFADRLPNVSLVFALGGVPFTSENVATLPSGPTIIVVDDAHHRGDLAVLFQYARNSAGLVRVLLVTRPYRVESLRDVLSATGFDIREIVSIGPMGNLTAEEVRQLAHQALGDLGRQFAERLSVATRDSPLVTVIGGQLLAERSVAPELLERDEELRRVLLDRFRDEITAEALTETDPDVAKRLLPVIAALSPIRPGDRRFIPLVSGFLDLPPGAIVQALDALEMGGVLMRRGGTLRITPDVLSDHLLYRECVGVAGSPTGFAQEVFNAFRSSYLPQVLGNLAELDWRIRIGEGVELALLNGVWASIYQDLRQSENRERATILRQLSGVAPLQPFRVLELVEFAMGIPAEPTSSADSDNAGAYALVLESLPVLLRGISYEESLIRRCCELLWELGRDDQRPTHQHPEPCDENTRRIGDLRSRQTLLD